MGLSKRKGVIYYVIAIAMLAVAGVAKVFRHEAPVIVRMLITTIFFCNIVLWEMTARHRIVWREIRRHITASAFMMIAWIGAETVVSAMRADYPIAVRHVNYAYYIVWSSLFVESLLGVVCIDKSASYRMSLYLRALHVPGYLLTVFFACRDYPHYCQYIEAGGQAWRYRTADIYALLPLITWLSLLLAATFFVLMLRAGKIGRGRRTELLILAIFSLYVVLIQSKTDRRALIEYIYETPELVCMLLMFLWEIFIRMGIVPSNRDYVHYFENLTTPAVLVDSGGNVQVRSQDGELISKELISDMGSLTDVITGSRQIHKKEVPGGYIVWEDDLTDIIEAKHRLQEIKNLLKGRDEVVSALQTVQSKQAAVLERDKLYSAVFETVEHTEILAEQKLNSLMPDDPEFDRYLAYLCVLTSYMKRRCNMVLLADETPFIDASELDYSLREIGGFLRIFGVAFSYRINVTGQVRAEPLMQIYDTLLAVFLSSVPDVDAILLNVDKRDEALTARFVVEASEYNEINYPLFSGDTEPEEQIEDGTRYVTVRFRDWRAEL